MTLYANEVYNVNEVDVVYRIHMVATVDTLPLMPRKPLPPSEKKVGIAARVDPQLLSEFQSFADADERTLSFMVEKAMRFYLEHHRKSAPHHHRRR